LNRLSDTLSPDPPTRAVVIMPVFNEEQHLPRTLQSVAAQKFDHDRIFFVAIDGDSSDGSADLLRRWLQESGIPGRVLSNPQRRIPISLNLGLELANDDDIVLRFDAHTTYGPTYVADAVAALRSASPDVGCIGTSYRPERGTTFEQRVVAALYTNPMGLGGADFRVGNDVRDVDNIYLGAWRAGLLRSVGRFNETLEANEDGEISARIRQMGYRILRVPLPCRCRVKRGVTGSIRQWTRYGFWRAKMLQRNPRFLRVRHIISPVAAIAAFALAISPLRLALLPLYALYVLLVFRSKEKEEPVGVTLAACAFFPMLQFGFGAGMLAGLLTGRGPLWPPQPHAINGRAGLSTRP
jgi:succinoglycan biosynthesis protein ExoA